MSNPNRLLFAALVAAMLGVLLLPLLSVAGTVAAEALPPQRAASGPSGLYQVRCWQHGRLLFEARDVELTADVVSGLKLRGMDRQRQPVMVSDTGNATCLIRSIPKR
jgi:hypothetical protein